jgi:hypothetical protein
MNYKVPSPPKALPIGENQVIEKGVFVGKHPAPEPPPLKSGDSSPPTVGEPGFWNIVLEETFLELRYSTNWLTVIPAILTGYEAFLQHAVSGNIGMIILAALFGLNAALRGSDGFRGEMSNISKAKINARAVSHNFSRMY